MQYPISFKRDTEKSETPLYTSSPYSSSYSTREKIRQLRKSFLEADPSAPILNKPKVNKYLSKERSGSIESSPSSALPESSNSSTDQSSCMVLSPNLSENQFLTDTVKMEELPKVHHAEIVSVRKEDSNSSSESETSSDDDTSINSKNIMVDIKPIPDISEPDGVSESSPDNITPRLEAPPQKQNIWGPGNRKKSLESGGENENLEQADPAPQTHYKVETDLFPNTEFSHMYENRKVRGEIMKDFGEPLQSSSPKLDSDTGDNAEEYYQMNPDNRFQDPALANYHETSQAYALDTDYDNKPKKKGFLSFFKKPNRAKDAGSDDFIHIDPRMESGLRSDSEEEEREFQDLYGDQSPRFHILPPTSRLDDTPQVSATGVTAQKSLFQPYNSKHADAVIMNLSQSPQYIPAQPAVNLPDCVPNQDDLPPPCNQQVIDFGASLVFGETDLDAVFKERQERKLDRKLSTSKPTNLDELMDEPLEITRLNESFRSQPDLEPEPAAEPQPEPVTERFYPEHERTQEIDIDAILGLDSTSEETEEELEKEQSFHSNSSEVDRVTRYNTYKNKSVAKAPKTPEPVYTREEYYPSQKITTVNGETTFSASPEFSYMQQFASELKSETFEARQSSPTIPQYKPYEIKGPEQYIPIKPMFNGKPEPEPLPSAEFVYQSQLTDFNPQIPYPRNPVHSFAPTQVLTSPGDPGAQPGNMKQQHDRLIAELSSKQKPMIPEQELDFSLEQRRLEEEQQMLSNANLVLQEQLEAKETERRNLEQNLVEESTDENYDDQSIGRKKSKPKSIFSFKKKEKPVKQGPMRAPPPTKVPDQPTIEVDERRRMPKQKSKSGFSFFSSKDKKKDRANPEKWDEENIETADVNMTETQPIHPIQPIGPSSLYTVEPENYPQIDPEDQNDEINDNSHTLAKDVVAEIMRSTANLAIQEEKKVEKPAFIKLPSRASLRVSRKKSKTDIKSPGIIEPVYIAGQDVPVEREEMKDEGFQPSLPRSESKSRFSMRMPKKKDKVSVQKKTEQIPPQVVSDERTDDNLITEQNLDQSRSTTPQSRPESRNRKEKPSGFAEMFGFRSSKRTKSVERPKSMVGSKSPGPVSAYRPKSSDISQYKPQQHIQQRKENSMASYFGIPSPVPAPLPVENGATGHELNTSQSDYGLSYEPRVEDNYNNPESTEVTYSQVKHVQKPEINNEKPVISRTSPPPESTPEKTVSPVFISIQEPTPQPSPVPEPSPEPSPAPKYEPEPESEPEYKPKPEHKPKPEYKPEPVRAPVSIVEQAPYPPQPSHRNSIQRSISNTSHFQQRPSPPNPNQNPEQRRPSSQNHLTQLSRSVPREQHQAPRMNQSSVNRPGVPPPGPPEAGGMRRQTGRQSGRFKKGSGPGNSSFVSHDSSMNASYASQGSNDAQSRFMDTLSSPEERIPMRMKSGSVGRVEGERLMREQGIHLTPAKSEESIRETGRGQGRGRGKDKKAGECSVM